ncbi:hypothetical protein J3A83DRAFT_4398683 [Scleroderma citrinum]
MTIMELDKAKYDLVGRKLACLLDPFRSPGTMISIRLRVDSGCKGKLNMKSEAITQQLCFYEGILKYAPGLADELSRMEATDLQQICSWITTGMNNQCSTDLGIIAALQEGLFNTSTSNWPACFYEEGVYDPEDKLKGLFHSHAAHQFYTHLFIGPATAAMDTCVSNASKPSKNHAWGLTELYFTLSTAPCWCSVISQMDLSKLLWRIIELFDDKNNWTHETIMYWNMLFSKGKMKTKHLSTLEHHTAEVIKFRTPPPEEVGPEASTSMTSSMTLSNIFSAVPESDLTSCSSDNEAESAMSKATNSIPQPVLSMSLAIASAVQPSAATPSDNLATTGPASVKKGPTPTQAKKPTHCTKKKNGF